MPTKFNEILRKKYVSLRSFATFAHKFVSLYIAVWMAVGPVTPALAQLITPTTVQAESGENVEVATFDEADHALQVSLPEQKNATYSVFYLHDDNIQAAQGTFTGDTADITLGTVSGDDVSEHAPSRVLVKYKSQDEVRVAAIQLDFDAETVVTDVAIRGADALDLSDMDEVWLNDDLYTVDTVELDSTYSAPQNDKVSVTFTQLPAEAGGLTIKEVELSESKAAELALETRTAYEITSSMENGTFTYDLTLPKPTSDGDVEVQYSEDGETFEKAEPRELDSTSSEGIVRLEDMDHFTVFVVTYSTRPDTLPGSYPSLGFQATSTKEFGDHIKLGGTERELGELSITMNNWACENDFIYDSSTDTWTKDRANDEACVTTPGSSYPHPITVNLYEVDNSGANPDVGPEIASKTINASIPFRPSYDSDKCSDTGNPTDNTPFGGQWYDPELESCVNGYAFDIEFDFTSESLVLPEEVIVGITYSTQSHGLNPLGEPGPYNSLNVSLDTTDPSVGENVEEDSVFWHTTYPGNSSLNSDLGRSTGWDGWTLVAEMAMEDTIAPTVNVISPQKDEYFSDQEIVFSADVTEGGSGFAKANLHIWNYNPNTGGVAAWLYDFASDSVSTKWGADPSDMDVDLDANGGSYGATITADQLPEGDYKANFKVVDKADNRTLDFVFPINIDQTRPQGTIDFPKTDEVISGAFTMSGTAQDVMSNDVMSGIDRVEVRFKSETENQLKERFDANFDPNTGEWSIDINNGTNDIPDDTYAAKAVIYDKAGNSRWLNSWNVIVDSEGPDVNVTSPEANDIFSDQEITLSADVMEEGAGLKKAHIHIWEWPTTKLSGYWRYDFDTGDVTTKNFPDTMDISSLSEATGGAYSATLNGSELDDGQYKMNFKVWDDADNTGFDQVYPILIDNTNPQGTIQNPVDEQKIAGAFTVEGTAQDVENNGVMSGVDRVQVRFKSVTEGRLIETFDADFDPTTGEWSIDINDGTNDIPDDIYDVKARIFDKAGNTKWLNSWNVVIDMNAPAVPSLINPEDGFMTRDGFTQEWSDVSDDGTEITYYYQSCYDDVCEGNPSKTWENVYSSTAKSVGANQPDSHFWWRVKAVDAAGNESEWSDQHELIIDSSAPEIFNTAPSSGQVGGIIDVAADFNEVGEVGLKIIMIEVKDDSGTTIKKYRYSLLNDEFEQNDDDAASFEGDVRGASLSIPFDTRELANGEYKFHFTTRDQVENKGFTQVSPLTISNSQLAMCKEDAEGNPLGGWVLGVRDSVQTLTMNVEDDSAVTSQTLPAGDYILRATGTYDYGPGLADAGYSDRPGEVGWISGDELNTVGGLEIKVDGENLAWEPFSEDHEYTLQYTHDGGEMAFSIFDDNYGDNNQSETPLQVEIIRVVSGTTSLTSESAAPGCTDLGELGYGSYEAFEVNQDGWNFTSFEDISTETTVTDSSEIVATVDEASETFTFTNTEEVTEEEPVVTGGENPPAGEDSGSEEDDSSSSSDDDDDNSTDLTNTTPAVGGGAVLGAATTSQIAQSGFGAGTNTTEDTNTESDQNQNNDAPENDDGTVAGITDQQCTDWTQYLPLIFLVLQFIIILALEFFFIASGDIRKYIGMAVSTAALLGFYYWLGNCDCLSDGSFLAMICSWFIAALLAVTTATRAIGYAFIEDPAR